MQTKLELLWYFFGSSSSEAEKGSAWGRVRGKHAQPRHGCMHRNLGALIAWQQRDVVDGGTEHGYRELYRPNAA